MTSDLEKSFKAKLRMIAKEKNRDPFDLWQHLTLERFLARLAGSPHRNSFILKGGILLSKYLEIGRETSDLDFLARRMSNQVSDLEVIFENIASLDLKDGFEFKEIKVNELAHPHMGYPGIEVSMVAYFGKTRFKVAIDIGFGDIVDPVEISIPLTSYSKGELFERDIKLSCYPKEFIFAEKLETVIYRGSFNSRMKDFHDLYSMINSPSLLPFENIDSIIRSVFKHRKTSLNFPIHFTEEEIHRLQSFWSDYLKNLTASNVETLPIFVKEVIQQLNQWIERHIHLNPHYFLRENS